MRAQNPFITDAPISNPAYFAGRQRELRAVIARLLGVEFGSTEVIGVSRSGKTSLLQHMLHTESMRGYGLTPEAGYISVYMDATALADEGAENFWIKLLDDAADSLMQHDFSRSVSRSQRVAREQRTKARRKPERASDCFQTVIEALTDDRLSLCLLCDEFDAIMRNPRLSVGFFDRLRHFLIGKSFAMVTASRRKLIELTENQEIIGSPFPNVFTQVFLGGLLDDERTDLLQRYQQFAQRSFNDSELRLIDAYGGHLPFFIQVMGRIIVQNSVNREPADERRLIAAFQEAAAPHFAAIWEMLQERERAFLIDMTGRISPQQAFAQAQQPLHPARTIRNLGLFETYDDGLLIFSTGFHHWIVERYGAPDAPPIPRRRGAALTLTLEPDDSGVTVRAGKLSETVAAAEITALMNLAQIVMTTPSEASASSLSERLYRLLFRGQIEARRPESDIVRLVVPLPPLAYLPWELLSAEDWTPTLVRWYDAASSTRLPYTPPTSLLIVNAGLTTLDAAEADAQIEALSSIDGLAVQRLDLPTPEALRFHAANMRPDCLHLIAPPGMLKKKQAVIYLPDAHGYPQPLDGALMAALLDGLALKVVTLASAFADAPYAGAYLTAQWLPPLLDAADAAATQQFALSPAQIAQQFAAFYTGLLTTTPAFAAANVRYNERAADPHTPAWASLALLER
jgi:hypothetical protein